MKRFLLATAAGLLLGAAAHAAPSYAVIALVGDKLDIVTFQPQIGSQLDNNSHMVLALPQDDLDVAALRAVNRALKATQPDAQVALLAASTPDSFANQDRLFDGSHVVLPAEIAAAVQREGAARLVLVTRHHGEARLQGPDGAVGSGKLDGLGYYVDTDSHTRDADAAVKPAGFIAPFVYVDVSLVDLATSSVMRRTVVMTSKVIGTSNKDKAVHPWDALTGKEKVDMLETMLTTELQRVVPTLVAGGKPPTQ
jgi:hypothetical protein